VHNSGPPHDGRSAGEFTATADEVVCQQLVELVTHYIEGALEPRTMDHVEEHLVVCDFCVTYVEQMRATIAMLQRLAEHRPPEPPASALAALEARREAGA
jgi:predicted anti-sigma-YlaC factor YlaD